MKKLIALLIIPLLCAATAACGRRPLTPGQIERNRLFAEIMNREDRRTLGDDGFFPAQLRDTSQPQVQAWCALALGRIGNPRALPWLYEALRSSRFTVRAAAAFAIGEAEDRDLLRSEGRRADQAASAEIRKLLDDTAIAVRIRAVEALGKIGQGAEAIDIIRQLESLSYDGSPDRREFVGMSITALMRLKHPAAGPALQRLADFGDPEIQWRAANAIYRLRYKEARQVLERLLESHDPDVRANAARALGVCGNPNLATVLTPLLSPVDDVSGSPAPLPVRVCALQALVNLKSRQAVPNIEKAIWNPLIPQSDPDWQNFAAQAASALGSLGSAESRETLRRLTLIPGPVADSAVVALAGLSHETPDRFFLLVEGARFDTPAATRAWARALGELGGERALRELRQMLLRASSDNASSSDSLAVPAVLQALSRAQAPDLQDILPVYLSSRDGVVLRAAVSVFKPDARAAAPWNPLLRAYSGIATGTDGETKVAILNSLEPWAGAAEVQSALRSALRDRVRNARIAAARILRTAGAAGVPDDPGPSETSVSDVTCSRLAGARQDRTVAILETTKGPIEIELFREDAPLTVANFLTLAERGFFDNLAFMRVVPYFVIQGGDPRNDQEGGPGYAIRCEIGMHPFARGSVGMALAGKDTGGSQFFITSSPQPHLDGGYTCFGRVISGMPAVERMVAGDLILRVRIEEDRTWIDYRRY